MIEDLLRKRRRGTGPFYELIIKDKKLNCPSTRNVRYMYQTRFMIIVSVFWSLPRLTYVNRWFTRAFDYYSQNRFHLNEKAGWCRVSQRNLAYTYIAQTCCTSPVALRYPSRLRSRFRRLENDSGTLRRYVSNARAIYGNVRGNDVRPVKRKRAREERRRRKNERIREEHLT